MKFEQLGLIPGLLKGIEVKGYKKATPIQSQAIPAILEDFPNHMSEAFFLLQGF